jgi:hypothetical protein
MAVDFRGHPMFQQTGFNAPARIEDNDESMTAPILQFNTGAAALNHGVKFQ